MDFFSSYINSRITNQTASFSHFNYVLYKPDKFDVYSLLFIWKNIKITRFSLILAKNTLKNLDSYFFTSRLKQIPSIFHLYLLFKFSTMWKKWISERGANETQRWDVETQRDKYFFSSSLFSQHIFYIYLLNFLYPRFSLLFIEIRDNLEASVTFNIFLWIVIIFFSKRLKGELCDF